MNRLRAVCAIGLFVAYGGCAEKNSDLNATVQGTVTIDGELATRGMVVFHPEAKGPQAYSAIFSNGTYALRMGQGRIGDPDGGKLRAGKYIATVVVTQPNAEDKGLKSGEPPTPGPRITAGKYASEATSDLKFEVKPGANVIPIEVERASEEELDSAAERAAGTDAASTDAARASAEGKEGAANPPATPSADGSASRPPGADGAAAPASDSGTSEEAQK